MAGPKKGGNDTLFLVVIVVFLVLTWLSIGVKHGQFVSPFALGIGGSSNFVSSPNTTSSGVNSVGTQSDANASPYAGEITIQPGNASSAYEPYQEYIVLATSYNVTKPIDITGWSLSNARGTRVYQVGSTVERFASNKVTIPKAVAIFDPNGSAPEVPVTLGPNQSAILITGSVSKNGVPVQSFRENECIGYIARDPQSGITIIPDPINSCPVPYNESGENTLDRACTNFISSMSYCHTPNFNTSVYVTGGPVAGYVDTVGGLSNSCVAYLQSHFSYQGCVNNHVGDANFLGNVWHVYLNSKTELWADQKETITLYDQNGKVVSWYSY